jgi:hypothetical protein
MRNAVKNNCCQELFLPTTNWHHQPPARSLESLPWQRARAFEELPERATDKIATRRPVLISSDFLVRAFLARRGQRLDKSEIAMSKLNEGQLLVI